MIHGVFVFRDADASLQSSLLSYFQTWRDFTTAERSAKPLGNALNLEASLTVLWPCGFRLVVYASSMMNCAVCFLAALSPLECMPLRQDVMLRGSCL